MKSLLILSAILLIGAAYCLKSENNEEHSEYSIMIMGNYNANYGISNAMNGSSQAFHSQLAVDYNNQVYPFGDKGTTTGNIGLQIASRLPSSPWGVYIAGNYYRYYLEGDNFVFTDYALMNIRSLSAGVEYTYGERQDICNLFARLGVNFNLIDGEVKYLGQLTKVNPAFRAGFESEFGGRFNIPSTPLSVELSIEYVNANLIGKSYTAFSERPPQTLDNRELNDGKNPNNSQDVNKNIIFITLRGGIKIWL